MKMWIVILFDQEESTPSDSVLEVYGPFESKDAADEWADQKWAKMHKWHQETRGLAVEAVSSQDE